MSRCRIRLVTSNFGTSTGRPTICVLFNDSYSYGCDVNTLPSSSIDNRQLESDINTSFVDSDSNNGNDNGSGLRVCAAMDGRQCHG